MIRILFFLVVSIETLCLIKSATPDLPAQRFSNSGYEVEDVFWSQRGYWSYRPIKCIWGYLSNMRSIYYNVTHWKGCGGWVLCSLVVFSRCCFLVCFPPSLKIFPSQVGSRVPVLLLKVPSRYRYLQVLKTCDGLSIMLISLLFRILEFVTNLEFGS